MIQDLIFLRAKSCSLLTHGGGVLKQKDFFASTSRNSEAPLAERMRPTTIAEFVGQQQLMAPEKLIGRLLRHGQLQSLILWGPPGCGKTTLARLIARDTETHLINLSAVTAGVKDVRAAVDEARQQQGMRRKRTILFVDEIHRFNKAQQDFLLPHVESGTVTFIGATTENPSFEVISPLLSRAPVVVLEPLSADDLEVILKSALEDKERGLGRLNAEVDEDGLAYLIRPARGDARVALNGLEVATLTTPPNSSGRRHVNLSTVGDAVQKKAFIYDKDGEEHYNLIAALHKSLRGSDPDGALYWLARMLAAGEDPLYLTLARMFHEFTPWRDCDPGYGRPSLRAVGSTSRKPGVLGCSFGRLRTSSPCDVPCRYASGPIPCGCPVARPSWWSHVINS